jgi:small subunit ribosomal protein S1
LGETLDFKVIEFKKDNRRIILSHSRIFEDEQKAEQRKANAEKRAAAKAAAAEKAATPMPTIEKTTLGDIDALAALRDKLAGK